MDAYFPAHFSSKASSSVVAMSAVAAPVNPAQVGRQGFAILPEAEVQAVALPGCTMHMWTAPGLQD